MTVTRHVTRQALGRLTAISATVAITCEMLGGSPCAIEPQEHLIISDVLKYHHTARKRHLIIVSNPDLPDQGHKKSSRHARTRENLAQCLEKQD